MRRLRRDSWSPRSRATPWVELMLSYAIQKAGEGSTVPLVGDADRIKRGPRRAAIGRQHALTNSTNLLFCNQFLTQQRRASPSAPHTAVPDALSPNHVVNVRHPQEVTR